MFKMNVKKKVAWLKALRSGKYNQGWGCLWNGIRGDFADYCCLGVARANKLCKGTNKKMENDKFIRTDYDIPYQKQTFVSETFLPANVQSKLSEFNDKNRWSFKEIANWIEKNL